jgi:hypothetical protein
VSGVAATRQRARSSRSRALTRLCRGGVAVATVVVVVVSWLVVQAVIAPGNGSFIARLAQAARDDGLGPVVTVLEGLGDQTTPSTATGGHPRDAVRQLATVTLPSRSASVAVGLQPAILPVDTPALAREGVFRALVMDAGQPAVQVAYLRPDRLHASYLAAVVWLSRRLTRVVQHPGVSEPGRLDQWSQPPMIPATARAGLAATFNGGFRLADSHGGFYADHHTAGRLTPEAASLVIYRDGHADIGSWGREVGMSPDVVSVRQNLGLLLDGGRLAPSLDDAAPSSWGVTLTGASYGWRSGAGVTSTGDLVYVAGAALSAHTLASLLQRAGAVRAMQLDINASGVSFMYYTSGTDSSRVLPHKVTDFQRPADCYFDENSRDFFAVYTR